MIPLDDTIAAISTPIGDAGIGIVRISGRAAVRIASKIFRSPRGVRIEDVGSHRMIYGHVLGGELGGILDEVLVSVMRAPRSYTREDVVEINCHNGNATLVSALEAVLKAGARLAEPGEFTRRAFLNGRIDLTQAEAVLDLIRAKTGRAERIALEQLEGALSRRIDMLRDSVMDICVRIEAEIDFPEEDIAPDNAGRMLVRIKDVREEIKGLSGGFHRGRLLREGISAAIVGKPNVGKSSLLNALVMKDRAIVTSIPGTTRDVIEEYLDIDGLPVRIMDTAGIRESHDLVEREGVQRSLRALSNADIVLAVFDGSRDFDEMDGDILNKVMVHKAIFVVNKVDISPVALRLPEIDHLAGSLGIESDPSREISRYRTVRLSALTGEGLDNLRKAIYALCMQTDSGGDAEGMLIANIRHRNSLDSAAKALQDAEEAMTRREPLEVAAMFLREALDDLGEVTGLVTNEEILDKIFSEFCIGK